MTDPDNTRNLTHNLKVAGSNPAPATKTILSLQVKLLRPLQPIVKCPLGHFRAYETLQRTAARSRCIPPALALPGY